MGLKPGMTNNPNGRPRGSPNRVTSDIRKTIQNFLEYNLKNLQAEYDQIEKPENKLAFLEKLLSFAIPKMASAKVDISRRIDDLNEIELNELIQRILDETEHEN